MDIRFLGHSCFALSEVDTTVLEQILGREIACEESVDNG